MSTPKQRLEAERRRLAAIDPKTWRDANGNPIAPMQDEHNQGEVDWETFQALYNSVDDIEKFLKS